MTPRKNRLVRVSDGAKLAGVCEGISRYTGVDPIWIRLAFLLMIPFGWAGFILYAALWLAMPLTAGTEWFE